MTNLYAYRKAKGLCYKCGLAYSRGHKCSDIVQLHLVEELWQLLDIAESDSQSESPNAQLNSMLLSKAAPVGQTANKTMKFLGSVQGIDVLILLDSGSSHTFLNSSMASQLSGCTPVATNLHVQVANASHLCCSSELVDMVWYLNDYQFQSTVRVLPLSSYDMIVGMDWLTTHNPMMVHWADKWGTDDEVQAAGKTRERQWYFFVLRDHKGGSCGRTGRVRVSRKQQQHVFWSSHNY